LLAGKYRVEAVLGMGGMGVVVSARHEQLDQRVAIKFVRPEALGNSDAIERFLREARAAVKLAASTRRECSTWERWTPALRTW
jgi:serine/threonine-protein kinase